MRAMKSSAGSAESCTFSASVEQLVAVDSTVVCEPQWDLARGCRTTALR